ncbi:MAG: hypothetical protein JWM68_1856 [Verrucomicrobiales bacterium]|nr:hypothetical protein [Verrucomicrobiales bacterium]
MREKTSTKPSLSILPKAFLGNKNQILGWRLRLVPHPYTAAIRRSSVKMRTFQPERSNCFTTDSIRERCKLSSSDANATLSRPR